MEQDSKVSPFFIIFEHEEWWPYVRPLVVEGNPYRMTTGSDIKHLDAEMGKLLLSHWQLVMHFFCGWLQRHYIERQLSIRCTDDAVSLMHNYVSPGHGQPRRSSG